MRAFRPFRDMAAAARAGIWRLFLSPVKSYIFYLAKMPTSEDTATGQRKQPQASKICHAPRQTAKLIVLFHVDDFMLLSADIRRRRYIARYGHAADAAGLGTPEPA